MTGGRSRDRPLYFLHIPKTAGTSLTAVLDARCAPGEIFPGQLLGGLAGRTAGDLRAYRLFRGHLGLQLPLLLGWRVHVVTVLRDPLERTVSQFAHMRHHPQHYLHRRVTRPGYDLGAFVRDPLCRPVIEHVHARWLGVDPSEARGFVPPVDRGYPLRLEAAFELLPLRGDAEELEGRAMATLDRATVVGVAERLPETIAAIAARLGWGDAPAEPRLNVSAGRPAIDALDPADLARLRELTALDTRLHRAAGRRLDELMGDLRSA